MIIDETDEAKLFRRECITERIPSRDQPEIMWWNDLNVDLMRMQRERVIMDEMRQSAESNQVRVSGIDDLKGRGELVKS